MDKNTLTRMAIWVGPILGSLIGVLGGAISTWCSIKNTKGPRERAFVVRASALCWLEVLIFLVGMWLVPAPSKYGLIAIYVVALVLAVRYWNRRQAAIRAEEANRSA